MACALLLQVASVQAADPQTSEVCWPGEHVVQGLHFARPLVVEELASCIPGETRRTFQLTTDMSARDKLVHLFERDTLKHDVVELEEAWVVRPALETSRVLLEQQVDTIPAGGDGRQVVHALVVQACEKAGLSAPIAPRPTRLEPLDTSALRPGKVVDVLGQLQRLGGPGWNVMILRRGDAVVVNTTPWYRVVQDEASSLRILPPVEPES